MVGHLVRSADFQRILATRPVARSARFAIHHLHEAPVRPVPAKLSTAEDAGARVTPSGQWFGLVVPKRHARRAVTRSLLKRQMRQLFIAAAPSMERGLWLIRLKAPFDRQQFRSAASDLLRSAARDEIVDLLGRLGKRS